MDGSFYKVDVAEKGKRRWTWRKVFVGSFGLKQEFEAKEKNEKRKNRVKDC